MNKLVKTGFITLLTLSAMSCTSNKSNQESEQVYKLVENENGPTLGYAPASGVKILEQNGYSFKDLNQNGVLDPYEDWRLPAEERAKDLASKMSIEQIAGLMLYSSHQSIPGGSWGNGLYNGKRFGEANVDAAALTDGQKDYFMNHNLRHILVVTVESPAIAAQWNNNAQAFLEGVGLGIPANNSSDPRHGAAADAEFYGGAGGDISRWPSSLGMAATFDAELVREFGRIASVEYRALGLTTALSPQVDIATDPRWCRFNGTFGESPELSRDMAEAYCAGFQYSDADHEIGNGWGYQSVNAMVKHWPGGGSGEAGRDAHMDIGKYAVFPGNNLKDHMIPFLNGAFDLKNNTKAASAVMPYYTISFNQDPSGKNVGNGYSKYMIQEQLRDTYGYEGVVCTDWGITHKNPEPIVHGGKPWGVEGLSEAEKHYMVLMAGVDQFGGNDDSKPIIEAYKLGVEKQGEAFMRKRFEESAVRLLMNIFRVGLFENPYVNSEESAKVVGKPEYMEKGFEAQLKSFVMLKNDNNVLPLKKQLKVYIPKIEVAKGGFMGNMEMSSVDGLNLQVVSKYFEVVQTPEEADIAIVRINSPYNPSVFSGSSKKDLEEGGNGYVPISLQYNKYTAIHARENSIAHDPHEAKLNRSYKNKSYHVANHENLDVVLETKKAMGAKPVIVVVNTDNPFVVEEFEKFADGIIISFGSQDQAMLEILTGGTEPSGLLPFQMPANMKTVELQFEDVPFDMQPHTDSNGNKYDFGFGLNWSGKINDERTEKYLK